MGRSGVRPVVGPRASHRRRRRRGPALTVDAVWFSGGRVLLVRRRQEPFRDRWALPGGFVGPAETVEQAVLRELAEETGLRPTRVTLLGVYSDPGRDPRGPTVSVAFLAVGPATRPTGGSDAATARWTPLARIGRLAFDHARILADARRRPRQSSRA